jgi:hypothetical protein
VSKKLGSKTSGFTFDEICILSFLNAHADLGVVCRKSSEEDTRFLKSAISFFHTSVMLEAFGRMADLVTSRTMRSKIAG